MDFCAAYISSLPHATVTVVIGILGLNGLEAAAHIQQISPQSKIVFLTQDKDAEIRSAALASGDHGYLMKIDAESKLLTTIAAALRNGHRPH
jgi:DNA-binding NarL/FixJ family response regulator